MWFRHHSSQGDPISHLIIPPALPLAGAQPALHTTLPTSHVVLKLILLSVQGYEVSLSLVFSCLFWEISSQFSCNSRLILGGG